MKRVIFLHCQQKHKCGSFLGQKCSQLNGTQFYFPKKVHTQLRLLYSIIKRCRCRYGTLGTNIVIYFKLNHLPHLVKVCYSGMWRYSRQREHRYKKVQLWQVGIGLGSKIVSQIIINHLPHLALRFPRFEYSNFGGGNYENFYFNFPFFRCLDSVYDAQMQSQVVSRRWRQFFRSGNAPS